MGGGGRRTESIQNLTGIRQRLNQEIVHVFESKSKSKAGYRIADLKTKITIFRSPLLAY